MRLMCAVLVGMMTMLVGFFLVPNSVQAKDDGQTIALSQDIPGKNNVGGRGGEYSLELYNRFIKAGGEAYLVTYKWRRGFEKPEQTRIGGMVVYLDSEGRYWAMDMYSTKPTWVPSKDPQKWIDRMYPNLVTSLVASRTEPKLAGQYADLSRVATAATPAPAAPTTPALATQEKPSAKATEPQTVTGFAQ